MVFYAFMINVCFFIGCLAQVNTMDPQISKSIHESKKNGFFIRTYTVSNCADTSISIKEAWLEKIWFYEIQNGIPVKIHHDDDGCMLCFIINQTPSLRYRLNNLDEWLMKERKSGYYVGIYYEIYGLRFDSCLVDDTITLDLIKRTDSLYTEKRIIVGKLEFKVIPSK